MSKVRLHRVYSRIDDFAHRLGSRNVIVNGVKVEWCFMDKRDTPPIPYAVGIENYERACAESEGSTYAEMAIDELFTTEEAEALKEYLTQVYDTSCEMEEPEIPIPASSVGTFCFYDAASESTEGCISLYKAEGYNLPFRVVGVYSVETNEDFQNKIREGVSRLAEHAGPEVYKNRFAGLSETGGWLIFSVSPSSGKVVLDEHETFGLEDDVPF